MARPLVPDDDLYARLELAADATPEAIELAWRALLRRHHPDVAGDGAAEVERAKRINVAHDWLSDPELRAQYDRERHGREVPRIRARSSVRFGGSPRAASAAADTPPARPVRPPRPRILDAAPGERVMRFLDRVGRLSRDELDRLSVAEPPPIAFVATIRRFLPPEADAELARLEEALAARVPDGRWADIPTREALRGVAAELVLGPALDELLDEPFRGRARERLVRAWEAAIDQPRYGPEDAAVRLLLDRAARLTRAEAGRLLRAAVGVAPGDRPWPRDVDPADDEALRVSAELADRDVAAAPALDGVAPTSAARIRRVLGRVAHAVALRRSFGPSAFAALTQPWRAALGEPVPGDPAPGPTRVRRTPG